MSRGPEFIPPILVPGRDEVDDISAQINGRQSSRSLLREIQTLASHTQDMGHYFQKVMYGVVSGAYILTDPQIQSSLAEAHEQLRRIWTDYRRLEALYTAWCDAYAAASPTQQLTLQQSMDETLSSFKVCVFHAKSIP